MNAIKPEINLSLFGRKKKVAPSEETTSTEELIDNAIVAAKDVAGAILIAVNTAGQILTNALDNRNTN